MVGLPAAAGSGLRAGGLPAAADGDAAALVDALECLAAIAGASAEGRVVVLESGGIAAAAAALKVRL